MDLVVDAKKQFNWVSAWLDMTSICHLTLSSSNRDISAIRLISL